MFSNPTNIPREWLVWEWLWDWNYNDSSWSWSNWTATSVSFESSNKWYTKTVWDFNWTTSWVDISNVSASNNLNAFTVCAFVKIDSFNTNQMPFSKNWKWFNIKNTWVIEWDVAFSTSSAHTTTTNTISLWEWNHILYTFNWSVIEIYLNWELCSYSTKSAGVWSISADNTKNWKIWRYEWVWCFLNGKVWITRLYNRVLSQNEIDIFQTEWKRKLWPSIKQEYPELFEWCVWFWDFRWDASNIINWEKATVTWATLTTDHLWNSDSAYNFDWVNDYISVPSSDMFELWNDYIVHTMIYVDNLPTSWNLETIIYRNNTAWTWAEFELVLYNDSWTQKIFVSHSTTFNPISYTLPIWEWILLSIWYSNNTITFYLNGVSIWTVSQSTGVWSSSKVTDFGRLSSWIRYFGWDISFIVVCKKDIQDKKIFSEICKKKYIYPFAKYTPQSLPKPVLHIDGTNNWTAFYDQSGNWNNWTQSGGVTTIRKNQNKLMKFDWVNDQITWSVDITWFSEITVICKAKILETNASTERIISIVHSWWDDIRIFKSWTNVINYTLDDWTAYNIAWKNVDTSKDFVFALTFDWSTLKAYQDNEEVWSISASFNFATASWNYLYCWSLSTYLQAESWDLIVLDKALTPKQLEEYIYANYY